MSKKQTKDLDLIFDDSDITYCMNVKCKNTSCARNEKYIQKGVIYSMAMWQPKDGKCEGWMEK